MIAGGFGVGKTTMVGGVSEIEPLRTEETITEASSGIDSLAGVEAKTTTTVSMDFGRITFEVPQHLVLYLFGTPGQDRFLYAWEELSYGAIGAVILADTRQLDKCFTAIGYYEQRGVPFVVAVNEFESARYSYTPDEVRRALQIPEEVPVLMFDARDESSGAGVLIALVEYALTQARGLYPGPERMEQAR
ncbi:ATP/GTP-binding protein [Streptomyces sp. NPDC056672]|uniref:GTP-binding protein n=1 Tax=Streptomyces sp. NPDC056672 TaxID=3345906 RepID=UPI0036CF1B72